MIGIQAIARYLPAQRVSNLERKEAFDVSAEFIEQRLGMRRLALCGPEEGATALGLKALERLAAQGHDLGALRALVVVTQNPDRNIPHASAEMHGRLGLSAECACFDISLGCSGWVYALSAVSAFMEANGLDAGAIVTADPYSKILDPGDRNTCLLFGDGATATLLSRSPVYTLGKFTFGTAGEQAEALACNAGRLQMNGRAIFNFAARQVPLDVAKVLERNGLRVEDVDAFIFHQGSRNIVETIARRLALPAEKVRFEAADYGNTVSSSIPMILADEMARPAVRTILVSGFGVGLSWSSAILRRRS